MMRVIRLGVPAALALALAPASALAADITVGRFYSELASAKQLGAVDQASAEAKLRQAGCPLPKLALDKSLTEGEMAMISNALGVKVTTQRPSQPVSETQMTAYMRAFAPQINQHSAFDPPTPDFDGEHHGKALKKGHHKSSSEPR